MTNERAKYDELDPLKSEIRLLVLSAATDPDSRIECALQTVSLDEKPAYEAVSYACGNQVARESIRLNDRDVDFPCSACAVLQALRYTDKPRTIWIDAICINQQDLEERASQVKMMGQVYRTASTVRVWLGADSEDDKDAISILQEMREPRGAE